MDRSEKSEETFGQSQSSCSRRVMWKLSDEQEKLDAVITYTEMQPDLALSSEPAKGQLQKCALDSWRHIFKLIHSQKLLEELNPTPSLALRYKPSHESLKYRRSKDFAQQVETVHKKVMTDVKMESCCLPPQQLVAVCEAAPKFGLCIPHETDSCCSAELQVPKNSPVVDISYASSKASNCVKLFPSNQDLLCSAKPTQAAAQQKNNNKRRNANSKAMPCNSKQSSSSSGNSFSTFRQRQLELHHYRVQVEKRRLDLLEVKIAREREDAVHHEILFHKDLQIRENQLKSYDDVSNI